MDRRRKTLPKKYFSMLAVVAFLALSVLTAYNMQTRTNLPAESKDTIGQAVPFEEGTMRKKWTEQIDNTESSEQKSESLKEILQKSITDDKDEIDDKYDEVNDSEEKTTEAPTEPTQKQKEKLNYQGDKVLMWPLTGKIVMPYSMDTTIYYTTLDQYACNDGILIGAKKGEEVKAAADGRIVNRMETDRYGTLLTLFVGNHYEISYGQLDDVKYEIGDEVKKGTVLGKVASPSRMFTLEGPHVYVKMTYKNEPVNPVDFLE